MKLWEKVKELKHLRKHGILQTYMIRETNRTRRSFELHQPRNMKTREEFKLWAISKGPVEKI